MPKSRNRKKKKKISPKRVSKPIYSPEYEIDFPLLSRISYEVWPKDSFNTITGVEGCKLFYNDSYKRLEKELDIVLKKYHSAAWVRESYLQLEAWTMLWFQKQIPGSMPEIEGPYNLMPIGRYGWRYILEVSLEKVESTEIKSSERPSRKDINKMFTLIMALGQCAELSNYLHFMPLDFSSIQIKLSPNTLIDFPNLSEEEEEKINNLLKVLDSRQKLSSYPEFSHDENVVMVSMISNFLESNFGFSMAEIDIFIQEVLTKVIIRANASIIVNSFEEMVELCFELSKFNKEKVRNLLEFICLDIKDKHYEGRNFLIKSQQKRMLNYCGAIIYLENSLETIYSTEAANYPWIKNCNRHIILAPMLVIEWLNNFTHRLVYGQRSDLKMISTKIKKQICDIEDYFHRQIFEKGVISLLEKKDFKCLTLKKIDGRNLECGEIDILAYSEKIKKLFIIESKSLAPARDAKAAAQVIKDHFEQKKYHEKFLRKIEWTKNNLVRIEQLFAVHFNEKIPQLAEIEGYFITGRSSLIKFMVSEYDVFSFSEFDVYLNDKYDF